MFVLFKDVGIGESFSWNGYLWVKIDAERGRSNLYVERIAQNEQVEI